MNRIFFFSQTLILWALNPLTTWKEKMEAVVNALAVIEFRTLLASFSFDESLSTFSASNLKKKKRWKFARRPPKKKVIIKKGSSRIFFFLPLIVQSDYARSVDNVGTSCCCRAEEMDTSGSQEMTGQTSLLLSTLGWNRVQANGKGNSSYGSTRRLCALISSEHNTHGDTQNIQKKRKKRLAHLSDPFQQRSRDSFSLP